MKQWSATVTWPNGVAKQVQVSAASISSAMLKVVIWSLLTKEAA